MKTYTKPELDIVEIEVGDIITTSCITDNPDCPYEGDRD